MFSVVDLFVISTHTLTWSVTLSIFGNSGMSAISTHTLTWSVTLADWLKYENVINFNSHAHVERDWISEYNKNCIDISTHTLTWSVTKIF